MQPSPAPSILRSSRWYIAAAHTVFANVDVSQVFVSFGIGDLIGAIVLGKMSDRGGVWRRKGIITIGAPVFCFCASGPDVHRQGCCPMSLPSFSLSFSRGSRLSLFAKWLTPIQHKREIEPVFPTLGPGKSVSWLLYVIGILYGVTGLFYHSDHTHSDSLTPDAAWNTQIYASFGILHPTESRVVFTIYQVARFLLTLAASIRADWTANWRDRWIRHAPRSIS